MNQQRWGHDGYQDGYQDSRQALPSRKNQAGSFSPDARETGDDCDTAKCTSRIGRHQSADLPVRSPVDTRKDGEFETVETATTPAKPRPRSKPKRPDVAIYVPRGRRQQQEHTNTQARPTEHVTEPKQERPAKKSAEKISRHAGALSMPRMRRPPREAVENQESAPYTFKDFPPEGDTSRGKSIVTTEDLLDTAKHKTKRKKGSGRTPDEKTGRDAVKKDGNKKRKDESEMVAPPGEITANDGEIHSLHSHNASNARSSECANACPPDESGDASCIKIIDSRVESHDALQDSAILHDDNGETMVTEPGEESTSPGKLDDELHQPLVDVDRLPGNLETDGSHDHAGSHIEAAVPAVELVECTDVPSGCSEQKESNIGDESCLVDEDMCRNVDLETQGETAASENECKGTCEECIPVDVMECAGERSDSRTKEVGLDPKFDTESNSQHGDIVSENFPASTESKDVVMATSELNLSVSSEKALQGAPLTTESLTDAISGGDCVATCGTYENSDTGNVLATRHQESCIGDREDGNSEGRCIGEESGNVDECVEENQVKEREGDANSSNELTENEKSKQVTNEICKSETERSEQSVCDKNESETNMDMQDDVDVLGETESNVHSGNDVGEKETESAIESSKHDENESCQLKPSADEPVLVQSKTEVKKKKTKKVKVKTIKTVKNDTVKTSEPASDSRQGDSVAMETEEEEDSWDALFDDTGEALDPKLVEELTVAVGKVKVQKPQFDYFSFQPKELEMDDDEYSHLVEIYDFPTDLCTKDLVVAFHEYKDKGFDVKWVDDSHAIGIFSSPISARGALSVSNPFMKVRPISQATRATKVKARNCTEFLQPYKERPETNASVARNLVAGALGLATRVPKEQREAERRRLREARAKKKQAKQQVVDVWEGRVGGCAMDEV